MFNGGAVRLGSSGNESKEKANTKGDQEVITRDTRVYRGQTGEPLTIVAPREELTIVSRLIPALATNIALVQRNGQ